MKIFGQSIYFFKSAIREKEYLFWMIAFPIILLTMLVLIFSSLYKVERINLNLYILKPEGTFSNVIEEVFQSLSSGEKKIFNLKVYKNYALKDSLISDLKNGKTHAILEIPENFDNLMLINTMLQGFGISSPAKVKIYSLNYSTSSQTASLILRNILQRMELEFAKKIKPVKEYEVESEIVGTKNTFSYVDFIYLGLVIYAITLTALFGIGTELVWYRESEIFKRFYVTPISPLEFFISFFLSRLYLILIQISSISIVCKLIYKSTVNPFSIPFIGYIFLSILTLSSFGLFTSAVSKNPNSANVIAQIVQFPMQFLGGIYFPVNDVPWVIKWFVVINPITYLASGIRDSLNVLVSPYPIYLTILIPLIYSIFFIFISIRKYRKTEF